MHGVYKFIKGKKKSIALVGTLYAYSGPHILNAIPVEVAIVGGKFM